MSTLAAPLTTDRHRHWRLGWESISLDLASAVLCCAFVVTVVSSLAALPRRTGDAHQYIAMAQQLSRLRAPSLSTDEAAAYRTWLEAQPRTSGFPDGAQALRQPALVRDDRQEFSHFWFFPLLVAPALAMAGHLGAHSLTAFTLTNAALLGVALLATARSFGATTGLFILASPVVWFVARAQVEVFTLAFLCLAICAMRRGHWGWASLALATASTQNAPIALAIPVVWLIAGIDWTLTQRSLNRPLRLARPQSARALAFATAAIAIALLHPAYYLVRLGVVTPQQLNGGIAGEMPSLSRLAAPLLDPNFGFLTWLPAIALFLVAGIGLQARSAQSASATEYRPLLSAICALIVGAWFLFIFAQTTNVNSGGTVHVSRYVLWLLPLTLPFVATTVQHLEQYAPRLILIAAVALMSLYFAYFRPDQHERYVEHSPQATWLLAHAPAVYQPLPEVFVERALHVDGGPRASAADTSCHLVFLLATRPEQACPLTDSENAAAVDLFATGAEAVWVRRGMNDASTVAPALPER